MTHKSRLEDHMETRLKQVLPDIVFERDYRFHPKRRWRFDFADLENRIAIECEGGAHPRQIRCHVCSAVVRARKKDGTLGKQIRQYGAHGGSRFAKDAEKYNEAQVLGWRVYRFVGDDILSDKAFIYIQRFYKLIKGE